jgi:hypothetical protein
MATHSPNSHIVVWRDPRREAGDVHGWLRFHLDGAGTRGLYRVESGQINKLAAFAGRNAIASRVNVTIGWGAATPIGAQDLETVARQLRPVMVICPERQAREETRWAISMNFGPPETMPEAAVQRLIDDQAASLYPEWRHGMVFRPHALLVRHDVSAECLGLVGPAPLTPDMICGSVADDPAVKEANARWDRATASTHRDLVAARLDAQARAGIAPEGRCPLYSGEVEGYLLPIIMRMGRGDEPAVVDYLRRDLRHLYQEHAETVLMFMLRTYRHGGTERLLEAARATAVAA